MSTIAAPDVHRGPYPLGYSSEEFVRLERQGAFLRDLTEDVLRRAGLGDGMSVLDIGCGVGDVSLLAAEMVGPGGAVLGIDRSVESIDLARRRADAAGRDWIQFAATELETFSTAQRFDAVIGRLVLMYLPDPAAALRKLCGFVRPGGIIAFQEMAMPLARSVPEGPLCRTCVDWILDVFARMGVEIDMGGKLFATFLRAGLSAPQMILAGRAEGGPNSFAYDYRRHDPQPVACARARGRHDCRGGRNRHAGRPVAARGARGGCLLHAAALGRRLDPYARTAKRHREPSP
jgi:SAM-dependent methyltransferase